MNLPAAGRPRQFTFEQDTFAFANELVWQYRLDPQTGSMTTFRTVPAPGYAHHCFVMVRSARQFFYHARFAPELPPVDGEFYRRLIRRVVARSARVPSPDGNKVIIPGFASLRAFSESCERLLKAACGGAWQSYCLRSHWRMVFPISRRHQAAMAAELESALDRGGEPIIHLVRFPQLTINHGMILFGKERNGEGLVFKAYDPNIPARPAELRYDAADRGFFLPPNHYWAGGQVDVIHVYQGWVY